MFLEELNLARIADETGFDSVWAIEDPFTPYTMVTDPLQYLTYLAGITRRVDLGGMVAVLPWHTPVRVAEDINRLSTLFGPTGNLTCGVGRGLGRSEHEGLSIDQAEARERFDESLQALNRLLATGTCDDGGKHYTIRNLRLRPQIDRDLSADLWCAGGTDETVEIIARNGVRPLVIPTTCLPLSLETARKYPRLRARAGYAPARTKLAPWTYCAETEADAQRNAETCMINYADSALHHYELRGSHLGAIKGYESCGAMQKALAADPTPFLRSVYDSHPWVTPDQIVKRAKELAHDFGCEEIVFIFKYRGMPMEMAEKRMRLFAKEVIPALKAVEPAPIVVREDAA